METETRTALAALSETMAAGFARMDRYFELQQAQFLDWRAELRGEMDQLRTELRADIAELRGRVDSLSRHVDSLSGRVDSLEARITGLERSVAQLRDFVTREIAEIRLDLRALRARAGQTNELRREIAELTERVDRLERRQAD